MKKSTGKKEDEPPMPPGTEPVFDVSCKDVVLGRGSGTQNHCGNVTYRKLVYLNKVSSSLYACSCVNKNETHSPHDISHANQELYATSSKFDKLKISKAIVAAIRKFGGRFLQAGDNGNLDIGDKRAWDKTSQALREGQTEIRAKLAAEEENPSSAQKIAEYKEVINGQTFLAYAYKVLESLYDPTVGSMTSCGPNCPHARRRATMNRTSAMKLQRSLQAPKQQQGNAFTNQQQLQNQQYTQNPNLQYNMPPSQNYGSANNGDYKYSPVSPETTFGGNEQYVGSVPPLPQMAIPPSSLLGNDANAYEAVPYNMPYLNQPQAGHQPQCTAPYANAGEGVWEPSDKSCDRDTCTSFDTAMGSCDTEALRKLLSDDVVDMESDEMSRQLSEMIKRKSMGLFRIDAVEAFEDLVFEEDSAGHVKFEFPEPQVSNAPDRMFSGLTNRGESLMNMSLLTIDDKDGASVLKAAVEQPPAPEASRNRLSRVTFKPEAVSEMSLDIGSIRDIGSIEVDDVDSPQRGNDDAYKPYTDPDSPGRHIRNSRAMGFPIRKTIMGSFNDGVPTVIPSKEEQPGTRKNVSTLTWSEASALQDDLVEIAKNVAPPSSELSLKVDNMSFSNMSLMSATIDESILGEDKKGVNQV